jgi:outer membrane protein TolC
LLGLLAAPGAIAAEPPTDLDALVATAAERPPEIAAFDLDARAAMARQVAAGRPMDPQWMLGVQSIGAMSDSLDPTMAMVGVEQMLQLPGSYAAATARAGLEGRWAEGERIRAVADLREALWSTAARLRAQEAEARALDAQLHAAELALSLARARYGAGAGAPPAISPAAGGLAEGDLADPPAVSRPAAGLPGMAGMSGGGAPMGAATMEETAMDGPRMAGPAMDNHAMGAGGMTAAMSPAMGGIGLSALLRLDTEVARARADRAALDAQRAGEQARLALAVGDEAAAAVSADPVRFFGPAPEPDDRSPERALAQTAIELGRADLRVARAARLPAFMLATGLQAMPEGMVNGVDVQLGLSVPLWGGTAARIDAAAAELAAAERRAESVDRGLAEAVAAVRAQQAGAEARAQALTTVALPRARAAWEASLAMWGAGRGEPGDLVAAWQSEVAVTREAIAAELATELARARLARLEGR